MKGFSSGFDPRWQALDAVELPVLRQVESIRLGGRAELAARLYTRAGEHGVLWYVLALAGAAADRPQRRRWLEAGAAVAASYAACTALKLVARRARPSLAAIGTESALSFPSSHTVTSFAAARTFSELLPHPLGGPVVYGAAAAMSASRLHFCVHYPSDVLAGAVLGEAAGRATVRWWRRQNRKTAALAVARRG